MPAAIAAGREVVKSIRELRHEENHEDGTHVR